MIFIFKDGMRGDIAVSDMLPVVEMSVLHGGHATPADFSQSEGQVPMEDDTMYKRHIFKLRQVGPNHFVYLEDGASLDLLKDEPRV